MLRGRPTGTATGPAFLGATLRSTAGRLTPPAVSTVSGTLALNGLYGKSGRATIGRATIEVGENSGGEGVVVTKSLGAVAVPGTSNLESVSCLTSTKCEAVGLATSDKDDAVIVTIVNGQPTSRHSITVAVWPVRHQAARLPRHAWPWVTTPRTMQTPSRARRRPPVSAGAVLGRRRMAERHLLPTATECTRPVGGLQPVDEFKKKQALPKLR